MKWEGRIANYNTAIAPVSMTPQVLVKPSLSPDMFLTEVRTFRDFETSTQELLEGGIPYLINGFWTSGQRQCYSIHEISYRACFKP